MRSLASLESARRRQAGFHKLADESGLSLAALLANELTLLRSDPGIRELIAAHAAYDEAFTRIVRARRKPEGTANGKT